MERAHLKFPTRFEQKVFENILLAPMLSVQKDRRDERHFGPKAVSIIAVHGEQFLTLRVLDARLDRVPIDVVLFRTLKRKWIDYA